MKLILEENDALPGEDERIIHDNSGEAEDTDTKEQNKIDKEVIKELEKRVDYVEDEINDAETPKPEATSGDGKSKGVDGITKAIKIKEKLTLPEPEDILSESIDLTGLNEEDDSKDLQWVDNRKLAILGQADDYGYDEYDLNEDASVQDVKELVEDYLYNKLSAVLDNVAMVVSNNVKGYNPDWCAEEIDESKIEVMLTDLVGEISSDLFANSGYTESLDEAIPKDAIRAYKSAPGYNPNNRTMNSIDYNKSNLTEITPEEANKAIKNGDESKIRLLIGGKLVKLSGGHGDTDYRNQRVDRDKWYSKKNGDRVSDTRYMPKNHLFQVADKIYLADEKTKDLTQMQNRAENPESRYSNIDVYKYAPAANIIDTSYWGSTKGSIIRGNDGRYGSTMNTRDLQRLANNGRGEIRNRRKYGTFDPNVGDGSINHSINNGKDAAARLRYVNSERNLQEPTREFKELKRTLKSKLNDVNDASAELQAAKENGSPEGRKKRSEVKELENRLKSIRKQLALLYYELEDSDAEDAAAVAAAQEKFDSVNNNYQQAIERINHLLGRDR